jgi:HlyD family secretion protein
VGGVRVRQVVDFTVDAYPTRIFEGNVAQVREAPITVQNVVTYDVVINVANPELLLKPGMTANVTIATARRDNVLRVPIAALRFRPQWLARQVSGGTPQSEPRRTSKRVWVLEGNRLKAVAVTTGLDDGTYAEITSGDLHAGDEVVTDVAKPANRSASGPPRGPRF